MSYFLQIVTKGVKTFQTQLYVLTKSHIYKMYGTLKKMTSCAKEYAEIHIQSDIEKGIWKILRLNIQTICSYFGAPSTYKFIFLKNTKISNFSGISKFLELIVSRQILAVLDSFRRILSVLGSFR
jgi:hypothetical protein